MAATRFRCSIRLQCRNLANPLDFPPPPCYNDFMEPDHLKRIQKRTRDLHASLMESKMWGEIHRMAETDPGMADLIEKVLAYYYLKKEAK